MKDSVNWKYIRDMPAAAPAVSVLFPEKTGKNIVTRFLSVQCVKRFTNHIIRKEAGLLLF
jgi:hypothetical protein